mgnify:CR=1 FL=1
MGKVKKVNFIGRHHTQACLTRQLPQKHPAHALCQLHHRYS